MPAPAALADHVQCGDVITQDTTLDSDLTNCPGNGVVIDAEGVTLDLGGHAIDGVPGATGAQPAGVTVSGRPGFTVVNGVIREFATGIFASSSDNATVRGLTFEDNVNGVWARVRPTNDLIEGNRFTASGAVFGNTAINLDEGILSATTRLAGNRILANTISGFMGGIGISSVDGTLVAGNEMAPETFGGIAVSGCCVPEPEFDPAEENVIERNRIEGNRTYAFGVTVGLYAHNNTVRNNSVSDRYGGIFVGSGAHGNRIELNRVFDSVDTGIQVGSVGLDDNHNSLLRNRIMRSGADGILVTSTGHDALVQRNHSFANGDDGIDVDVAGVRVESNWVKANADWGIEAVPGVIDDRRNRARKNGQPEQCLNVRCRP